MYFLSHIITYQSTWRNKSFILFLKKASLFLLHRWSISKKLLWQWNYDCFPPYFYVNALISSMHIGHANLTTINHPNNMPYVGKSFIVHINATLSIKFCFLEASYLRSPSFHSIFKLLINSCKYTYILLLRLCGLGIIKDKNI